LKVFRQHKLLVNPEIRGKKDLIFRVIYEIPQAILLKVDMCLGAEHPRAPFLK
jgi:hypothetical protein